MGCGVLETVFASAVATFVLLALCAEWHGNSLVSILRLRHGATYRLLGRPDPLQTSDSDKHGLAVSLFVVSDSHRSMADQELTRKVMIFRVSYSLNVISILLGVACLILAPDPKALLTFACWRNPV